MPKLPSLGELLLYRNCLIIDQYCHEHPLISRAQAEQYFQDLLAWLWLCVERLQKKNLKTHMIQPLKHLDLMWHIFILNTRSYHEFCEIFFADYLHHEAGITADGYELSTAELTEYLTNCYDSLGEKWVARNFAALIT
jgi:hypothetical protein